MSGRSENMIQQTQFNSSDGLFNQSSQMRSFDSGVLLPRWEYRSSSSTLNNYAPLNSTIQSDDTRIGSSSIEQQQQQQTSSNTMQYPFSSTKDFCDEIDDIMKHDDVLLISPSPSSLTNILSPTSTDQEFDLDTFNDYLEPQPQFNKHLPSYIDRCSQHPSISDIKTNYPSQPLNISSMCPTILSPPSSTSSPSFLQLSNTQPVDVIRPTSNSNCVITLNNLSNSNSTLSHPSSSLGISPKFINLSLNCTFPDKSSQQQQQIVRKTGKNFYITSQHPQQYSPLIKSQTQQLLGTSYPFEVQQEFISDSNQSQRNRSANRCGLFNTIQCTDLKIENKSPLNEQQQITSPTSYISISPSSYLSKTSTTNGSSSSISNESNVTNNNNKWPYSPRPVSNSFSEVQQQQSTNLSSSYGGFSSTPSFMKSFNQRTSTLKSPIRHHSRSLISKTTNITELNFQQTNCTLYSLNNSSTTNTTNNPLFSTVNNNEQKQHSSLSSTFISKGQDDIKDDPSSPTGTVDLHSESDLWSDMENDHFRDEEADDNDAENFINSNELFPKYMTQSNEVDTNSTATTNPPPVETSNGNQSSLFWQYNVQAKGPKTKRVLYLKERDPHLYREFSDPVYQIKLTQTKGHTLNKLRKGDGNDVTPNPMKLYQLGKQIQDLSSSGTIPSTSGLPCLNGIFLLDHNIIDTSAITAQANDSLEVKKEKNKIASRACRLRKKAQHEANKLKLHGLNEEHKALIDVISSMKLIILKRLKDSQFFSSSSNPKLEPILDQLLASKYHMPVAGNTDGFVQSIVKDLEHIYTSKRTDRN
ncbi:unnamed protein product [Didymodactylos carnosus]|uniref:BZIP domain-containing protein n=1 Tax=Didymodactylos carnosus TaxID=1234261 RepID=A0A8S2CRF0_9BILA|nr:unnamed protein product [Didymodactylos carnosus]CAF3565768.1 unnamed protein product [Didymodactylos carnosus]